MTIEINTMEIKAAARQLRVGDRVLLSGAVYTARDAAHRRLYQLLDEGGELPFNLKDAVIYYTGPTPAREGMPVGSCGPTTASRMDGFTPRLLDLGLGAMIGKGERSQAVIDSIVKNGALYLCAIGGAGALMARHVLLAQEVAFAELGCESIKRLEVEKLPLTVGIDSRGDSIFTVNRLKYQR